MKRWLLALLALLVLYAAGVVVSYYSGSKPRVSVHERVPNGEDAATIRIVEKAVRAVDAEAEADGLHKRDAHAKPHGCLAATFTVPGDIPQPFRKGIFLPTMEYKAWLRFSNGTQADDTSPDARGLGLKVMGVAAHSSNSLNCWTPDGEALNPRKQKECSPDASVTEISQDFNLINHPVFFLPDVMAYEEFFGYQVEHNPIAYFVSWNPLKWKTRGLVSAARNLLAKLGSPLDATYYSMTAFKLGPHNAKYAVAPCEPREKTPIPKDAGPDFLREALAREVPKSGACFEFKAQLQDPSANMPIEDPMVEWQEKDSKYETLARIAVPAQHFNTDAQNQFCEQLSITPWQGTTAHRPIGGLNRVRRAVYEATSARRHARNGVVRHEPRGFCLKLDGTPCPEPDEPPGVHHE